MKKRNVWRIHGCPFFLEVAFALLFGRLSNLLLHARKGGTKSQNQNNKSQLIQNESVDCLLFFFILELWPGSNLQHLFMIWPKFCKVEVI